MRRRVRARWLVLGALVALAAITFVALDVAWISSPNLDHLGKRVTRRLKGLGGHAVALHAVAPAMRKAIVAAEDERFYQHHGIDAIGIARALAYDVSHLSTAQGSSTITEKVADLIYMGGDDESPWEKMREAVIAVRLESDYSKAQILDAYLNSVNFGRHAEGIAAASRRYFGVSASHLGLGQASLLAGLPQNPRAYDPFRHPIDARQRQAEVLRSMVREHLAAPRRARRVASRRLSLAHGPPLAPLRSADLTPEAPLAVLQLVGGLAMCVAAIVVSLVARRRGWGPVPLAASALLILAGALVTAGSVRVA